MITSKLQLLIVGFMHNEGFPSVWNEQYEMEKSITMDTAPVPSEGLENKAKK